MDAQFGLSPGPFHRHLGGKAVVGDVRGERGRLADGQVGPRSEQIADLDGHRAAHGRRQAEPIAHVGPAFAKESPDGTPFTREDAVHSPIRSRTVRGGTTLQAIKYRSTFSMSFERMDACLRRGHDGSARRRCCGRSHARCRPAAEFRV